MLSSQFTIEQSASPMPQANHRGTEEHRVFRQLLCAALCLCAHFVGLFCRRSRLFVLLLLASSFIPVGVWAQEAKSARDLYNQAARHLVAKDIPQATLSLARLVDEYPQDELAPLAAMRLAQCYMSANKMAQAIEVLEKWLPELAKSTRSRSLDPAAELEAQAMLARAYLTNEKYDRVTELAHQVSKSVGNAQGLGQAEQRAVQTIRSLAAAADQRRQASQAGPLREAARLVKEKRYPAAQAELAKVDIRLLGADWVWRYHVLAAQCHLGLGKPQQANDELQRIELSELRAKEQVVVRMLRMEAAVTSGSLTAAERELDALSASSDQDPQQAATLALRRIELALLRKDRDAVNRLVKESKEKYPHFESLHEFDLLLARNLMAQIEFDEARRVLETIVQSPPAHDPTAAPRAEWLLGESRLLSQEYAEAASHYSRVIESNRAPTWTESALMQRAKCYEMLGQTDHARNDYSSLLKEFPASSLQADARNRLNQLAPVNR